MNSLDRCATHYTEAPILILALILPGAVSTKGEDLPDHLLQGRCRVVLLNRRRLYSSRLSPLESTSIGLASLSIPAD